MNIMSKEYLVGLYFRAFNDQNYIADRNEWITVKDEEGEKEAIKEWMIRRQGWIKDSEKKFIRIFGTNNETKIKITIEVTSMQDTKIHSEYDNYYEAERMLYSLNIKAQEENSKLIYHFRPIDK
jgi:hypothetical protein